MSANVNSYNPTAGTLIFVNGKNSTNRIKRPNKTSSEDGILNFSLFFIECYLYDQVTRFQRF